MDYPTYLIHYGIPGQKWGVRRFQNEDGTYTSEGLERRYTKEGYKSLKKDYRKSKREATKEYNKKYKETRKKVPLVTTHKANKEQYDAINNFDKYSHEKAQQLFNKYKDLKIYKAKLKGKEFDTSKLGMKTYFNDLGFDIDDMGYAGVVNTYYTVGNTPYGVRSRKHIVRYSYIP